MSFAIVRAAAAAVLSAALLAGTAAAEIATRFVPREECAVPPLVPLPAPGVPTAALVAELLGWIGANTGYDAGLRPPPEVTFCAKGDLIVYEDGAALVGDDLRGLYDLTNRRVILVRPWSADDPLDRAALLHELVHHVQLANRGWDCLAAPEWEAYKLQEAWLNEQGLSGGFDWLAVHFASRCPKDHHP